MPERSTNSTAAALDATIERSAEVVRRSYQKPGFLKRLGLSLPVTVEDVKQAYYVKAREAHPDHNGDPQQFKEIQRAFDEAVEFAKRNGKRLPWIGAQLPIYVAQRDVVDKVQRWGGRVVVEPLEWLEDTVGQDFASLADRLTEIDLAGADIGDAEVGELIADPDGLRYLEVLGLANTRVTNAGALKIAGATRLKLLDLRGTPVTIGMRKQLQTLRAIESVAGTSRLAEWARRMFG
ncbi:DnaJ domain protein [Pirellulimonas nuda]|uniref:DnaJ domain protein n=1 Tax=Pirellulimonas nuda TaxID=2528009 RepID=A0A518D8C6_9BACT|nr:DnaJ domain-containing protein [Pirellulimonas nuda]QDU87718.1 DnaJ domain protein [Pirellulimonas nuda]